MRSKTRTHIQDEVLDMTHPTKIVAFMGSPRLHGNTDILLDTILDEARKYGAETNKIALASAGITPCIECGGCDETGVCILKDSMTPLYDTISKADYVIVASPMFFYNITSYTQALVERAQAFWVAKYVLKKNRDNVMPKQGVFVSVGATKGKTLFNGALLVMKYFFDAIDATFSGSLLYKGVEKKGAIKGLPSALEDAKTLGRLMAEKVNLSESDEAQCLFVK